MRFSIKFTFSILVFPLYDFFQFLQGSSKLPEKITAEVLQDEELKKRTRGELLLVEGLSNGKIF